MSNSVYPLLRNAEVKGAYFRKKDEPDLKDYIAAIDVGEPVEVRPITDNQYDDFCAEVYHNERWIGFLAKEMSAVAHYIAFVNGETVAQVMGFAKNGNPLIVLAAVLE